MTTVHLPHHGSRAESESAPGLTIEGSTEGLDMIFLLIHAINTNVCSRSGLTGFSTQCRRLRFGRQGALRATDLRALYSGIHYGNWVSAFGMPEPVRPITCRQHEDLRRIASSLVEIVFTTEFPSHAMSMSKGWPRKRCRYHHTAC